MTIPTLEAMLQAGVHFGHQVSRWHPKMKEFIFTQRNGVHIIDLEKTQQQLEAVLPVVEEMTKAGKKILFVSTKAQAKDIVKEAAIAAGDYIWRGAAYDTAIARCARPKAAA